MVPFGADRGGLQPLPPAAAVSLLPRLLPLGETDGQASRSRLIRLHQALEAPADYPLVSSPWLQAWASRALAAGRLRVLVRESQGSTRPSGSHPDGTAAMPLVVDRPAAGPAAAGLVPTGSSAAPLPAMLASTAVGAPLVEDGAPFACRWKTCRKDHQQDVNRRYPRNGVTERGDATSGKHYADEWVSRDLEPWKEAGAQRHAPGATAAELEEELTRDGEIAARSQALVEKAMAMPPDRYTTEKHHVISVSLFPKVSQLNHNCKLIGYNVNDGGNGICLPYFAVDIVRHDRQCHRGPHPKRHNNQILDMLKKLAKRSASFCQDGRQAELLEELSDLQDRIRRNILTWAIDWELRSDSQQQRIDAYRRIGQPLP
jgi:hypothetical protein